MALSKTMSLTNSFGTETVLNDVYIKIDLVEGSKDNLAVQVGLYAVSGGQRYTRMKFDFVPQMNNENFIAQGYAHLKTRPEFTGAIDC